MLGGSCDVGKVGGVVEEEGRHFALKEKVLLGIPEDRERLLLEWAFSDTYKDQFDLEAEVKGQGRRPLPAALAAAPVDLSDLPVAVLLGGFFQACMGRRTRLLRACVEKHKPSRRGAAGHGGSSASSVPRDGGSNRDSGGVDEISDGSVSEISDDADIGDINKRMARGGLISPRGDDLPVTPPARVQSSLIRGVSNRTLAAVD